MKVQHLWAGEINFYMPTMYYEMLKNYILLANEVHTDNFIVVLHSILILNSMQKKKLINNSSKNCIQTSQIYVLGAGFGEAVRITTARWKISKVCNAVTAFRSLCSK